LKTPGHRPLAACPDFPGVPQEVSQAADLLVTIVEAALC